MNEFTASNGVRIVPTNSGATLTSPGESWPNPEPHTVFANADIAAALREFYQAERDEELGRWRYPDDRDYVVYPVRSGDVVHVLNEKAGLRGVYARGSRDFNGSVYSLAAIAYFETHPERKPWEDAKEGEVWLVTVGRREFPIIVKTDAGFPRFVDPDEGMSYGPKAGITTARRIWPESD